MSFFAGITIGAAGAVTAIFIISDRLVKSVLEEIE